MNEIINKITEVVDEKFKDEQFKDCFIVEISISKSYKVEIFADCDSGMTIEKCAIISRHVGKFLEQADLFDTKYTLEVSSPGFNRPLLKRQYFKNIGRYLRVKMKNDTVIEGMLSIAEENRIVLDIQEKKEIKKIEINYDDIDEAKLIVKFNKKQK
jgi:ribosome maturation factor RimP